MPYIVSKRLTIVLVRRTKVLLNLDIYITLNSHYRAVPVAIVVIEQTSGTGITEYFLDILQEGYIVFYDIFQGNYTIIEVIGSHTHIGVKARAQFLQNIFKTHFTKLYVAFSYKLVGLPHDYRASQQGLKHA